MNDFYLMGKSKTFSCPSCLVVFRVTVEPSIPGETIDKQYPKSAKFLKKLSECPVCGAILSEEEDE